VRLLALDVDGVLTDGGVYVLADGREFRRFDIKDGLGLKRVMRAGIRVSWISSGSADAVMHRAEQLGIDDVHLGVQQKLQTVQQICTRHAVNSTHICYLGDDLVDLEVMQYVGVACAPRDAVAEVRQVASYVTQAAGGHGAVREVCDLLIQAMQMDQEG
jgi:3-deoxy-D-manno-octulosonate 8-phosphate phosphatase (KDO 8-P phosphatase)